MNRRLFLRNTGLALGAAAFPAVLVPPRIVLPRTVRRFEAWDRFVNVHEFREMQAADEIRIDRCTVMLPEGLRLAGKEALIFESYFICDRDGLIGDGACGQLWDCDFSGVPAASLGWVDDPSVKRSTVYKCLFVMRPMPASVAEAHPFIMGPEDLVRAYNTAPIGPRSIL